MKIINKVLLSIAILGSTTINCGKHEFSKQTKKTLKQLGTLIRKVDGNKHYNGNVPTSELDNEIYKTLVLLRVYKDQTPSEPVKNKLPKVIDRLSKEFGHLGMVEVMEMIEIQNSFR